MTSPPNFDRVARMYRWAEYLSLGRLLERTRNHYLSDLAAARHALVLGDGDGRFLAELLRKNSSLHAVAVDTSERMLHLLAKRCHKVESNATNRLRIHHGSALGVTPAKDTDLIVTHFFLDCFTQSEVDTLTQRVAAQVSSGTLWLLSDFAVPSSPFIGPLASLYVRSLYLAFRLLTGLRVTRLPDPQQALTTAGFERFARHERLAGVLYTELWRRT